VDRLSPSINYSENIAHEVNPIEEIGIEDFDGLWKKYDIIELNTCVKPCFFRYLFHKYDAEFILYIDPDIQVFNKFSDLENLFLNKSILLTPHILTPLEFDNETPNECNFLNHGIYNLGFLGLKNDDNALQLLKWWEVRTLNFGYNRLKDGLFVDQLWMNFVPLYFNNVHIIRHLGYNMAPWNLHERFLSIENGTLMVNNIEELLFFHFSSYDYREPEKISKYYSRSNFDNRPDLKGIYKRYDKELNLNKISTLSNINCFYVLKRNEFLILEKKVQRKKRPFVLMKRTIKKVTNKLTKW
jgi:hypothetical protein